MIKMTATIFWGAIAICSSALANESWPDFHGIGRTNISQERDLLQKWPEQGPPLLWSYDQCGRGFAGVVIAEDKVFTAGDFGREERLLSFDLQGKLLWEKANGQAWLRSSPGARCSPTYCEGMLYHLNPLGRLAAFKAQSGDEVWAVDLTERFSVRHSIWGFSEHVIVEGNKVICMPGGSKGRIVALDRHTGKTLWVNKDPEYRAAYCSGRIVTYAGFRQFITLTQGSVVGLNVENGDLLWSTPFEPTSPQNALTPVFHDGHVFISCGHSTGGALLKIDMEAKTAKQVWYRQDLDDCHSGALLVDNKLFGCACRMGGKAFFCVDYMTGETLKQDKALGKVGMTCVDGKIYGLNHRGTMFLLDIIPSGFEILSQFELPRKPTNSYLAHPVVCDGRLYIRSHQDLFVYDIRK